jgi:hypothetical protein
MSEWQPIESAPKDGKAVLVYDYFSGARDGFSVVVARFTEARGWHVAATVVGGIYVALTNPIYWMPLPAPPEAK